jgi:CheY-like chemotaxis protein
MPTYTFRQFEHELREALSHLYDLAYEPPEGLYGTLGCDRQDGLSTIRRVVFRAIEGLQPPQDAPASAFARQVYDLLRYRFVLKLTQEETSDRLYVSRRTINRLQERAAAVLAGALWERRQVTEQADQRSVADEQAEPTGQWAMREAQARDWRSQAQRELQSLRAKTREALSDVGEAIGSAVELVETVMSEVGVRVDVRSLQPGLVATVHPVVLDQVLIGAIRRLASVTSDRQIAIYARREDGNARITLRTAGPVEGTLRGAGLEVGVPMPGNVSVRTQVDGTQVFVWIDIPSPGTVRVLVVDDNEDMLRFYHDCAIGTRYQIVAVTHGGDLSEALQAVSPEIIVLDVMLPDIDGWRLLMRLHEDPSTRSIPIVVCTVVREENLAISLGAACFLEKPVRRRDFIGALDRVLPLAAEAASRSPTRNAETC